MGLFDSKSQYNTGRSWHSDRRQHNKSEDWEKPMRSRKNKYADGGGVESIKNKVKKLTGDDLDTYKFFIREGDTEERAWQGVLDGRKDRKKHKSNEDFYRRAYEMKDGGGVGNYPLIKRMKEYTIHFDDVNKDWKYPVFKDEEEVTRFSSKSDAENWIGEKIGNYATGGGVNSGVGDAYADGGMVDLSKYVDRIGSIEYGVLEPNGHQVVHHLNQAMGSDDREEMIDHLAQARGYMPISINKYSYLALQINDIINDLDEEYADGGSIEENKRMAVETFLGGLTNDELYYVANEYADLDWDDDANLDNQIQMWIDSLSNQDINMLHEELLGYKRGGKVDGRSTRAKDTWNRGGAWTRDRNKFNKSQDWEIPMNKRSGGSSKTTMKAPSKSTTASTPSKSGKSKYSYIPNAMLREAEVENKGKTTYIDGADILDGIYVKKGTKYADGGEIRRFDRHANMGGETRRQILDYTNYPIIYNDMDKYERLNEALKKEGFRKSTFSNYLYGLFDGYDYSDTDTFKEQMAIIKKADPEFHKKISSIYEEIKSYPEVKYADGGGVGFRNTISRYNKMKELYQTNRESLEEINDYIDENYKGKKEEFIPLIYSVFPTKIKELGLTREDFVFWLNDPYYYQGYFNQDNISEDDYANDDEKAKQKWDEKFRGYEDYQEDDIYPTNYKDGGRVKKYNYVPNRMIQAMEVERNGKTTEIDGANILDGIYVKGKVKFADGGMAVADEVKSMKEMMDSCYTYGGLDKGSYNYERYILPYKGRLGEKMFDKVYNQHSESLKSDYEVEGNTYTDSEGLTYNTLKKKYAKGGSMSDLVELYYVQDANGNVKNISKSYIDADRFLEKSLKFNGDIRVAIVPKEDWEKEMVNTQTVKRYADGGGVYGEWSKDLDEEFRYTNNRINNLSERVRIAEDEIKEGLQESRYNKYANGGGVGGQMDYGSDLTDESTIRGNITDGEIHCDTLTEIIGCEPNYPCHNVGSLKLTKCFLRPYYKIG